MNNTIYNEIIPTLDLPMEDLTGFAAAVTERFNNPYIDHRLLDISLNSTSKWKARVLPSVTEYYRRTGCLPKHLTFSFAAYLAFYRNAVERGEGFLTELRGNDPYQVKDDAWVLDFFYEHRNDDASALVHAAVNNERMWGSALADLPGFEEAVVTALRKIETLGANEAMREVC
jgi:tagaturonate reductase